MTNTKFLTLAALIAGAMALPISAANAKTSATTAAQFKKADTDKSGTLSAEEYSSLPGTTQSFSALDTNGDSVLTMSELNTKTTATGAGSATTSSAGQGTGAANDAGETSSGSATGTDNSGSGYNGRQ